MADRLMQPGRVTPRAMLTGAVALVVLVIVLAVAAVSMLSSPEGPEPVTMAPATAPVVQQPVPVGAARPVVPKQATRVPTATRAPSATRVPSAVKATPKHNPAQDSTGQAYENGMEMARHAAGGAPWSGFVP